MRLFGPRWQNRPEAGIRALRGPLVRKGPSTRPKGNSDSGGPHRPAHAATAAAPLGLRLCKAKPERQARARPPGGCGGSLAGLRALRPSAAQAQTPAAARAAGGKTSTPPPERGRRQAGRQPRAMGLMALLCPKAGHLPEASARGRFGDERPVGTNATIRTESCHAPPTRASGAVGPKTQKGR